MLLLKYNHLLWVVVIAFISLSLLSCFHDNDDTPEIQVNSNVTIDYEYDNLSRLTKATYSDGKVVSYAYDEAGNIIERKVE